MGGDVACVVLTDGALLERFLAERDEDAFAELVRRHGPLVRATCLRYLGNTPEVDDAFQTVFLVLVRKARHIAHRDLLAPWLYTVAVRAARQVLVAKHRTQRRERSMNPIPEPMPTDAGEPNDWLRLLDDALQSLPAKYRVPLILCELEGQSRQEAAERLAVPEGTLSSRLARGRVLLRQRLSRRGVAVSLTVLAGTLTMQAAAAVPPALNLSTTQAALTGHASASVAALTQGVLHAMFISKLKLFTGVFTALVLAFGAGGLAIWPVLSAQGDASKGKADKEFLQGSWSVVSAKMQGKELAGEEAEKIKMFQFVFKGDKLTTPHFEGDYTLRAAKSPKEIDIIIREVPANDKEKTIAGIYEINDQELRICLAMPDEARPVNFDDPKAMIFDTKRDKK